MPRIHIDPQFEVAYRKYIKGNRLRSNQVAKAIKLLSSNPQHPSLNLEKLAHTQIWSVRVTKGDRIFLIWSKNQAVAILFWLGKHDSYRKYK